MQVNSGTRWDFAENRQSESDVEFDNCDLEVREKQLAEFFCELANLPFEGLIENVETELKIVRRAGQVLPVTINDRQFANSYICSPYTGAITYPVEELHNLDSRVLRILLRGLLGILAPILRSAQINKILVINNQLFSTCLYPESIEDVAQLSELAESSFPNHAQMFRSLNESTNGELLKAFRKQGFLLIPSRQVYLFRLADRYWSRVNCRRDQKKLRESRYRLVSHDEFCDADDARIKDLYDQLYLDKYSRKNPQYSEKLIRLWRKKRLLTFQGYRHPDGTLDGIVGCFQVGKILSAPLVGYEMKRPKEDGLYRMLMASVMNLARKRELDLNLSSGAADFKRVRGGVAQLEFSAVKVKHLRWWRRTVWWGTGLLLNQIGARILKKYKL